MKLTQLTFAMLALGLSLNSPMSLAETASNAPTVIVDAVEIPLAVVTAVDPTTREVDLRNQEGEITTVVAGPEIRNFAQIKVGDTLNVRMMQALLMEVRPKKTLVKRTEVEAGVALAPQGGQSGVATGRRITTTVTIQALDMKKDFVKFTLPDGEVRSTTAKTAAGKELLHTLKVGDQVDVVFTEATGLVMEPAAKK